MVVRRLLRRFAYIYELVHVRFALHLCWRWRPVFDGGKLMQRLQVPGGESTASLVTVGMF